MTKNYVCTSNEPVVSTKAGKIRGCIIDGTYTFHGIKYCDAERFGQPKEVAPWDGIKDALSYGMCCPMLDQDRPSGEALVPHRYWPMDEHCQYLNIWTQSVCPKAKKPVMVWLHGGGFAAGSSIEQVAYEGDNMSKFGDVVVVTLNHRLNILGYMDLSSFGEKYKNSGNAGNADMLYALKWIHDNIANFGGDPDNVTLFGQSGGGMKVWTLMQTPEADGLFHKGVIQSGLIDGILDLSKQDGTKIVNALMEELGFTEVAQLETVPYNILADAYKKVAMPLMMQGEYVGGNPMQNEFYLGDPRVVGFTDHAKSIPVMIGTVLGEFAFAPGIPNRKELSSEEVEKLVAEKYGKDNVKEILDLFTKAYPEKAPIDVMILDSMFRSPTKDFIKKKSFHKEAPTYSYMFNFEFPYDDGKIAWHCSEIPFVFHNTVRVPVCNVPGVSDRLEEQVFSAWINFARYGDPNSSMIPSWDSSVDGNEVTMIFDTKCYVTKNHDDNLIELHKKVAPKFSFGKDEVQH